ncbi:MAG: thiopeptide-type bacteriocin biosynthesis protein [Acidobacteriota bacterium]
MSAPTDLRSAQPPVSVVDGRRWFALHLAGPQPRREILVTRLWPLASQLLAEGLADRFFFIRYNEGGPHLRLRLRLPADAEPGIAVAGILERAARAAARDTEGLVIAPQPFELEIERYGGPSYFAASLDFFALSSLGAIDFHQTFGQRSKNQQLPSVLARLLWQASGFAVSPEEFTSLLDYYASFSGRYAAVAARAEAVFDKNPAPLQALFEQSVGALLEIEPSTARDAYDDALALAAAVEDVDPARRHGLLASQMHMTANRLGLRNPEETYATRLLSKIVAAQDLTSWWPRLDAARQRGLEARSGQDVDRALHTRFQTRLNRLLEEEPCA